MISRISRFLEHSLATKDVRVNQGACDDAYEDRIDAIDALTNPAKRYGALVVHHLVGKFPEKAYDLQTRLLKTQQIERVGTGFQASVFRDGNYVVKAYRDTALMDEDNRSQFRAEHVRMTDIVNQHLGTTALPHCFEIGPHPVTRETVVLGKQAFVNYESGHSVFPGFKDTVDEDRIEQIERCHRGAGRKLAAFADRSLDMYSHTGYLPDTFGSDNLVVGGYDNHKSEVLLIDTVPHREYEGVNDYDMQHVYKHIKTQLTDLLAAAEAL